MLSAIRTGRWRQAPDRCESPAQPGASGCAPPPTPESRSDTTIASLAALRPAASIMDALARFAVHTQRRAHDARRMTDGRIAAVIDAPLERFDEIGVLRLPRPVSSMTVWASLRMTLKLPSVAGCRRGPSMARLGSLGCGGAAVLLDGSWGGALRGCARCFELRPRINAGDTRNDGTEQQPEHHREAETKVKRPAVKRLPLPRSRATETPIAPTTQTLRAVDRAPGTFSLPAHVAINTSTSNRLVREEAESARETRKRARPLMLPRPA